MITRDFEQLIYGDYAVVYADPPWSYRDVAPRGGAAGHYAGGTMTTAEICELEVKRVAADDAVLFLWATWPNLFEAHAVIDAWGFEYRTVGFDWVKTNDDGTIFMGVGHYTRSNTEPCLLAVRGAGLERLDAAVKSVVMAPRGRHSAKPDEVRYRIERLYGDVKRVELFAREARDGWDAWGDEAC
jgi:site-specific DNA-methyltransferase (adenine-specific)